jgi:hypothetical protein
MRVWPSVAEWRTILKASSDMLGRTWNTWAWAASRRASEAANGREEDRALGLGHRRASGGAGGADEAEQHLGAFGQQLASVGAGPGGVKAVVELAQLELQARVVLAAVERVEIELGAGGEGQADFATAAEHQIPDAVAQLEAAVFELGQRPVVGLVGVAAPAVLVSSGSAPSTASICSA